MLRAAVLTALLAVVGAAEACGVCVEDKMAAVYDHTVVTRALNQKHYVAFFHVDGNLVAGEAERWADPMHVHRTFDSRRAFGGWCG